MLTGNAKNVETYKRMYETMKHAHAYPNTNLVRLEKWFLKEPGDTLDHGCGYGENLIFLASRGYRVTGVDVSENLIEYVRVKCEIRHTPPTLYQLQVIDGEGPLPFADEAFDHVVSLGVLEMMGTRETARTCIDELVRCLKPGGRMIVSTLAPENYFPEESSAVGDEAFEFTGTEVDKPEIDLAFDLFIPADERSFAELFSEGCEVHEIGSWNNNYCGVNGRHFVALVSKK